MDELHSPKSASLRRLYWRREILQVMYWLHGEGLGDVVDAALLERFLGVDAAIGIGYLDQLVVEGYLEWAEKGYTLSERGRAEGAEEFAAAFADITNPAHGECSPDCWCHASVDEAEACAAERVGAHGHD